MAFSYQKLSPQDIEKYHLDELYRHYAEKAGYYYGVQKGLNIEGWMIDKEEKIWLIQMCCFKYDGGLPPIHSSEIYYILNYKGKNIEVLMVENRNEGSIKFSDNPFRIRWEILSIKPFILEEVSFKNMIKIIANAMKTHPVWIPDRYTKKELDIKVKYVGSKPWKKKVSSKKNKRNNIKT